MMQKQFDLIFQLQDKWPTLAWLAHCDHNKNIIIIQHGAGVETQPNWYCEAVWDGPYSSGNFDQTDIVSGSGGHLREHGMIFVSSGSTVDRLQSISYQQATYISNSLVCLMAYLEAEVDPVTDQYYQDFRTIVDGLEAYKSELKTSKGEIKLTYFNNLLWDGDSLSVIQKPFEKRTFDSFNNYQDFLLESLAGIKVNMDDSSRQHTYSPLGTLSTGYDSSAVTVLAKQIGIKEVISFVHARGGQDDDGSQIASQLGLKVIRANRNHWRGIKNSTVPFIAVNGYGEEVHYTTLQSQLQNRVLLTGYHGDKVWAKEVHDLSSNIVRGDPTGLSLSEFRLEANFFHCPLPFWGVRQIADINRISNSKEMKEWDIPGNYSRPICRRIVESAGVERSMFGQFKRATSVVLWNRDDEFLPSETMSNIYHWLKNHRWHWIKQGKLTPLFLYRLSLLFHPFASRIHTLLEHLKLNEHITRLPILWRLRKYQTTNGRTNSNRPTFLFYYLFPWAIEQAKKRYQSDPTVSISRPKVDH